MNNQEFNNTDLSKKERKVLRTKFIILNAAKEVFLTKSFETITMDEIAESAALSRATLYNYFNTKEEIYFNLGITKIEQWIEDYKLIAAKKYPGAEILLILTENLVKDILEFPPYSKLLRRFFYRSKQLNLDVQLKFYYSMVENKKIIHESDIEPQYKIFNELLEVYINYRRLWQETINIGLMDGSIKSTMNPYHLNFISIMLILGFLDQLDFRGTLMKMVKLSEIEITAFILKLVKKLLNGEI